MTGSFGPNTHPVWERMGRRYALVGFGIPLTINNYANAAKCYTGRRGRPRLQATGLAGHPPLGQELPCSGGSWAYALNFGGNLPKL
jgi:hypothetical protein